MEDSNINTKHCYNCSNYGCLINQGYWWCNAGHTDNMDAENCDDYDSSIQDSKVIAYSSSTITIDNNKPKGMSPKEFGIRMLQKRRVKNKRTH